MTIDLSEHTAPSLFVFYSFYCLAEILDYKVMSLFSKISACFKKASSPLG